jgi:hypothetical protein
MNLRPLIFLISSVCKLAFPHQDFLMALDSLFSQSCIKFDHHRVLAYLVAIFSKRFWTHFLLGFPLTF